MLRLIQIILILSSLCGLGGCLGPGYGPTYGYPDYGYSPYSYGWPVYARGYEPMFNVHHPWEEHHGFGHNESFFHSPEGGGHSFGHGGGEGRGYGGGGHGGGGHGGGGHR
ncbi:MAG TPA: hypothetical protein VNF28_05735 [Candidatus Binataceae bacterium]|nr:hypothetical protein [Candidatus Binataceae bacterium]